MGDGKLNGPYPQALVYWIADRRLWDWQLKKIGYGGRTWTLLGPIQILWGG